LIATTGSFAEVTSPPLVATDNVFDPPSPTLTVSCAWSVEGSPRTWTSSPFSVSPATTTFSDAFPYGTTVVICTATDGGGNTSPPASFRVVVSCDQGYSYDTATFQCRGAEASGREGQGYCPPRPAALNAVFHIWHSNEPHLDMHKTRPRTPFADNDECHIGNGGAGSACDPNANCNNWDGGYTCTCKAGYLPAPGNTCTSERQSAQGLDLGTPRQPAAALQRLPHLNISCPVNHPPSDENECNTKAQPCGANTVCTDEVGSYDCPCKPGFTGDGFVLPTGCTGEHLNVRPHFTGGTQGRANTACPHPPQTPRHPRSRSPPPSALPAATSPSTRSPPPAAPQCSSPT
jgi:hypothetical protein